MRKMTGGEGFGKVILFGEHFVVHGISAIAAAISNKVTVNLEKSKENEIITDYPVNKTLSNNSIQAVEDAMNIKEKFKVHFDGDLPIRGGLGSSAAFCVALARAFSKYYFKNPSDEEINSIAYEGEKVFHGNPSGIDNTTATYGGAILFKRGKEFKKINLGKPLHLIVALTGKVGNTKELVSGVKKRKDQFPEKYNPIFTSAEELVSNALIALEKGDLEKIGSLMNKNQELLSLIEVSSKENDELVSLFRESGALGAKLTGGGGGGSCIALAKDSSHAKEILEKVKEKGFEAFYSKVSS